MAALTTFYHPLCSPHNHRTTRQAPTRHSLRSLTVMSCRKQKSPEESQGVIQRTVSKMISAAEKMGKNLKPEKKGDMKDLMLMNQEATCLSDSLQHRRTNSLPFIVEFD
ncbi:hypothetical protein YC2023_102033 [Brassica napus]